MKEHKGSLQKQKKTKEKNKQYTALNLTLAERLKFIWKPRGAVFYLLGIMLKSAQ